MRTLFLVLCLAYQGVSWARQRARLEGDRAKGVWGIFLDQSIASKDLYWLIGGLYSGTVQLESRLRGTELVPSIESWTCRSPP